MKYILKVDGMRCGMCETHVNDIVRKSSVNIKVKSSHRKGITVIKSKESIDIEPIKTAITNLGYRVLDIKIIG